MAGPDQVKAAHDVNEVVASGARTADGNGTAVRLPRPEAGFVFVLDHTVDEAVGADLCDVYVQTMTDGTNWVDVVHFAQHNGVQGVERRLAKILTAGVLLEYDNVAALAASGVRHIFGDEWRARWVIVNSSTNASFTFSVTAIPM